MELVQGFVGPGYDDEFVVGGGGEQGLGRCEADALGPLGREYRMHVRGYKRLNMKDADVVEYNMQEK